MRLEITSTKTASSPLTTSQLLCGESGFKYCDCLKDSASAHAKLSQIKGLVSEIRSWRFVSVRLGGKIVAAEGGGKERWIIDTARD